MFFNGLNVKWFTANVFFMNHGTDFLGYEVNKQVSNFWEDGCGKMVGEGESKV